jgi:hypothetical protein
MGAHLSVGYAGSYWIWSINEYEEYGAGGGGYYGGGIIVVTGANNNYGGGGGSSWANPTFATGISYGLQSSPANGQVIITY